MNKLLQLAFVTISTAFIFMACSGTKQAASATKNDLKGNWAISATSVDGVPNNYDLRITSFDDASLKCFQGSEWTLPNNGYGNYNITANGCEKGQRQILWSTRSSDGKTYLNFKKMDGVKRTDSKKVAEGYSLEVAEFGRDYFIAKSPVQFEGKTIYIVYEFRKR